MTWFRRKKETKIKYIAASTLIRNIIYDSLANNPEGVAKLLGLQPVSDEVSEMEDRASEHRISRMAALLPIIEKHSEIAGKVSAASYAISSGIDEEALTEELLSAMAAMFKVVSYSACISCISQLVDLELIEVNDGQ